MGTPDNVHIMLLSTPLGFTIISYAMFGFTPFGGWSLETGLLLEDYLPLWMHADQLTYQVSDVKTQKDWLVFDFDVPVLLWFEFKINN